MALQPNEVAATHWVPIRALLSPSLRVSEYVDISSRFARQSGPIFRHLLSLLMGKMVFSAVELAPSESLYGSSIGGFIPENSGVCSGVVPTIPNEFVPLPHYTAKQRLLLWGLTLGVLGDLLQMLPPHNAVQLWRYPTFTTPDLAAILYLLTYRIRRNNASNLSTGSLPSQTAADATAQAVAVSEAEPRSIGKNDVGISGLGVGSRPAYLLRGYYERVSLAVGIFLCLRAVLGSVMILWALRRWRMRR